jgi:hypothetical protein
MDCAGFERVLEQVISGELPPGARDDRLRELREHAHDCAGCAGTRDLLEWLEMPEAERDAARDPGEAYWSSFNERVRRRVEVEPVHASPVARVWVRWAGVTAALLLAAVALWLVLPLPSTPPVETVEGAPGGADDPTAVALELPEPLVELIEKDPTLLGEFGPGAVGDEGWAGAVDESGWIYPDTEDLDPAARRELLEWLRDRTPESAGVRS